VLCNLIVLLNCVKKLNCVVENLVEGKKIKEQIVCFVLQQRMQGNLFILESWMEVATWVEEIQLVAMAITKGKRC